MWSDIDSRTIEAGEFTLKIRHVHDENPDISHFGKYTDKPDNFVVDRQEGILFGEDEDEPEAGDFVEDAGHWYPMTEEDPYYHEWEAYEKAWSEWNKRYGYLELATDLSTNFERGEFRYFAVSNNNLPFSEKGWSHVDTEVIETSWAKHERTFKRHHIDTGDKRYDLSVLYACEDYERMVGLERNDWYYMGVVVEVYARGVEIGYGGLWGIESDSNDDYIEETEQDIAEQALKDAAITLHDLHASDAVAGFAALREALKEDMDG